MVENNYQRNTNNNQTTTIVEPVSIRGDEATTSISNTVYNQVNAEAKFHNFVRGILAANVLGLYVPLLCVALLMIASAMGSEAAQYFFFILILPLIAGVGIAVFTVFSVPYMWIKYRPVGRDKKLALTLYLITGPLTVAFAIWNVVSI